MPDIDDVLADAQREIKAIGDNVTNLKDSMTRDLAVLRKQVEDAPKSLTASADFKKDVEALAAGVLEKGDALEKNVKRFADEQLKATATRLDDIEKRVNRGRLGGGGDPDAELKEARDFTRVAMAKRGELKATTILGDDKIDLDGFKSYRDGFHVYMRRDVGAQGVEEKTMSIGSDPDGGYFVTPKIGAIINGVVFETSPMRDICTIETISGTDGIEYPRDDDEASCGWVGEQEDRPNTNTPQVGMQRIPVHELYANPKVTQKLLEDAAFDVEGWLGRKTGAKFGRTEATAFVSGNGVKKPRGFVTYANGKFKAGSSGMLEQIAAGTGAQVKFDDLITVLTALKEYYLNGANWLMQRGTVGTVMLLKDGEGRYIWQPNQQAGKPSVLLGYEVVQAADLDAVSGGKLPVAFGNFKMGYTIVDRLGISTLRDPFTAKPFIQFYSRKRVGGDVTNFEAIKLLAT